MVVAGQPCRQIDPVDVDVWRAADQRTHRVAIGVIGQGVNEHAERHFKRLRGVNPLAVALDLGEDEVLCFGRNDLQGQCASRNRLAVNRD